MGHRRPLLVHTEAAQQKEPRIMMVSSPPQSILKNMERVIMGLACLAVWLYNRAGATEAGGSNQL